MAQQIINIGSSPNNGTGDPARTWAQKSNANFTELYNTKSQFTGYWSASNNTPSLGNGTGKVGQYYRVSAGGSVDFGAGAISFNVGDIVHYDGSQWFKISGTSNTGVSGDSNNALSVGSDNLPFFNTNYFYSRTQVDNAFVPQTRSLSVGDGLQPIGDLSQNRTIELDFNYLDGRYSGGFKQLQSVRVTTVGNITLSGLQTVDGVSLAAGNRVLVRMQTNASQNGVYVAASGSWSRSTDFDQAVSGEIEQGASVFVEEGNLNGNTGWTLETPAPITVGTTALSFIQYAGAASYQGGNNITVNGNQINHDAGSWTAKNNLSGATVISNIAVDAYGHPTNWTTRNLTAANIGAEPSFSKNTAFNKNYGTTAGTVLQGNWRPSWGDITGTNPSYTKGESDGRYLSRNFDDIKQGKLTINGDFDVTGLVRKLEGLNQPGVIRVQNTNTGISATSEFSLITNGNNFSIVNYPDANTAKQDVTEFISTAGGSSFEFNIGGNKTLRMTGTEAVINGFASADSFTTTNQGDGAVLINFNTERPWSFQQVGTGAATQLSLIESTGSKLFSIGNNSDPNMIQFFSGTGNIISKGVITATNFIGNGSGITNVNADRVDGKHVWTGTQAAYDALGSKDGNTIYYTT
ncbi:hypothetical protein HX109_15360 [Galbibacter sp. BG1]|uniref:phage upper tail fiber protein n=1 Tax=Galbibacter sp. BG1 TaxID=1170699 RepID=UPI0015BF3CCE|nr:hypothetical protein [Galbibacter sp. BG1]QLE02877.1 hypothetical protein HX109_15360 [Galbibacter sp. BG1]